MLTQPLANRLLAHPELRGDLRRGDPLGIRRGPLLDPSRIARSFFSRAGGRPELAHGALHKLGAHSVVSRDLAHGGPSAVLLDEDCGPLRIHKLILSDTPDLSPRCGAKVALSGVATCAQEPAHLYAQ